jgi:hypothetical protein
VSGGASRLQNRTANFQASVSQARESSDNPILNAFCRVAPSDRFSFLAIFAAGAFLRAIDFSSRTCTDVQARLFFPFFISASLYERRPLYLHVGSNAMHRELVAFLSRAAHR